MATTPQAEDHDPPPGATPAAVPAPPAPAQDVRADYYVRIAEGLAGKPPEELTGGLQDALRMALRYIPDGDLPAFWTAVTARVPGVA